MPRGLETMDQLAAPGVVGFKAFICDSGVEEFPRADDLTLYEGMQRAAALGLPVAVHAENQAMTRGLAARAVAAGRGGLRDYLASRPTLAETEAIARALLMAREAGCAVHVAPSPPVAAVDRPRARRAESCGALRLSGPRGS